MLIKKKEEIRSSEITGQELYFDRRKFLSGAATLVGAAALGAAFPLRAEAGEAGKVGFHDSILAGLTPN